MFSEDAKIIDPQSDAAGRMQEYARVLGELHVVATGKGTRWYAENLYVYPAPLRILGVFITGWKLCRSRKFDAITVQGADDVGIAGFLLAYLFHIPFQLQLHTDILSSWYRRVSWKERVRYGIALFLIPRADSIRVVSERIKNSILAKSYKLKAKSCIVLPIFTDFRRYLEAKRNPKTDKRFENYEFKMIAVGRFVEKEKNFLMLIDVMRDFVKMHPNALLVIVGEGPDEKNYKSRIMNYGLKSNVILELWREDLASFYKSFDLFLLSSNYEGWGRVILEAMASGLPVVTTDVGLASEVVKSEKNGLVVQVQDRSAFLHAVEDLYKNREKRKKLAEAGLETIKNLASQTKEEYLKKYKESFKIIIL